MYKVPICYNFDLHFPNDQSFHVLITHLLIIVKNFYSNLHLGFWLAGFGFETVVLCNNTYCEFRLALNLLSPTSTWFYTFLLILIDLINYSF